VGSLDVLVDQGGIMRVIVPISMERT
jgi:hypothetical protein